MDEHNPSYVNIGTNLRTYVRTSTESINNQYY